MLNIFVRPTPKQFYYLVVAYVVITVVLGCFLSDASIVFLVALMSIFVIVSAQNMQKTDKVRDKQKLQKQSFFCFGMAFALFLYLVFSGFAFREEFILKKDELQQVVGTIPKKHTHEHERVARSTRNFYYLTIGGVKLHCGESDFDDCEKMYDYQGKRATVYYQPETKNGNLAYEIVVNDTKPIVVYSFDSQLTSFQENRKKENTQLWFAFVLYVLPAFYLWFLYRRVAEQLQEMNDEEKAIFDEENTDENIKKNQLIITDYGFFWSIVCVLGCILMASAFATFFIFSLDKSIALFILSLLMFVIAYLMIYFSCNKAKINRDIRLGYIDDKNNTDNADDDFKLLIKNRSDLYNTPSSKLFLQSSNNQSQSIKFKDFGRLGIFCLLLGSFLIFFGIFGAVFSWFDNGVGTVLFWLGVGFVAFVVFLMIYKPYTAILNKDMREGLYDDYKEDYEELSLVYKIFRVVALFILILLFLLLGYYMLIKLIKGEMGIVIAVLCILFVIGYGIKKLW